MHFKCGDYAGTLTFDLPADDSLIGATLSSGGFTFAGAAISNPVIDEDTFTFTSAARLQPGIIEVNPTFLLESGTTRTIELEPVVVEPKVADGWITIDRARMEWPDAPYSDAQLARLLDIAKMTILAYVPRVSVGWSKAPWQPGMDVPESWATAQMMQARNSWNASRVDPANAQVGEDSYVLRPYPLDWFIKSLLRPKRGIPAVA